MKLCKSGEKFNASHFTNADEKFTVAVNGVAWPEKDERGPGFNVTLQASDKKIDCGGKVIGNPDRVAYYLLLPYLCHIHFCEEQSNVTNDTARSY